MVDFAPVSINGFQVLKHENIHLLSKVSIDQAMQAIQGSFTMVRHHNTLLCESAPNAHGHHASIHVPNGKHAIVSLTVTSAGGVSHLTVFCHDAYMVSRIRLALDKHEQEPYKAVHAVFNIPTITDILLQLQRGHGAGRRMHLRRRRSRSASARRRTSSTKGRRSRVARA